MTTVTIWHNVTVDPAQPGRAMLNGYRDGDLLAPVATYHSDDEGTEAEAVDLTEEAFHLFNVGHDPGFGIPDPRAVTYRDAGNRSLSVGDVVQVGAFWLAVESVGFRCLSDAPTGITLDAEPVFGTTPIAVPPDQ